MAIHSTGQTVFSLTHIEGITLGIGEELATSSTSSPAPSVNPSMWMRLK